MHFVVHGIVMETMKGFSVFGLIYLISGIQFGKGAHTLSGCKPVNLLMVLSGDSVLDATHYTTTRDTVLGVAGNLAPGSNLTLVALGQTPKHIFHGKLPEQEEHLDADLEEHRASGFLSGDTLSGQLLWYAMNTTWDVGETGANISMILTTGTYDRAHERDMREISIVTVLKMDKNKHSDTWDVITADEDHFGDGTDTGSMTVQNLSQQICKDAAMVCGTSKYAETDGELLVCRHCSSICAGGRIYGYCSANCPYYMINEALPATSVTTRKAARPAQTTSKPPDSQPTNAGVVVGAIVGGVFIVCVVVGGVAFFCYKRRKISYRLVRRSVAGGNLCEHFTKYMKCQRRLSNEAIDLEPNISTRVTRLEELVKKQSEEITSMREDLINTTNLIGASNRVIHSVVIEAQDENSNQRLSEEGEDFIVGNAVPKTAKKYPSKRDVSTCPSPEAGQPVNQTAMPPSESLQTGVEQGQEPRECLPVRADMGRERPEDDSTENTDQAKEQTADTAVEQTEDTSVQQIAERTNAWHEQRKTMEKYEDNEKNVKEGAKSPDQPCRGETGNQEHIDLETFNSIPSHKSSDEQQDNSVALPTPEKLEEDQHNNGLLQ